MRDRVYKGESLEDRLENAAAAKRAQVEKMKAQIAKRAKDAKKTEGKKKK